MPRRLLWSASFANQVVLVPPSNIESICNVCSVGCLLKHYLNVHDDQHHTNKVLT